MIPESELDWRLADYQTADVEPPERIIANPKACEGELMTAAEVARHISDSIGTMLVLLDSGSPRFDQVRLNFLADLDCLLKLSKITQDEYNEITTAEEFNL